MNNQLKDIFFTVNDWLKFAEAKNSVIIALNGAVLFQVLDYLKHQQNPYIFYYAISFSIFCLLAILTAILSFAPQTKLKWLFRDESDIKNPSLLFFGHLANHSIDNLLSELKECIATEDRSPSRIERDYAEQIITNSKIVVKKLNYFRIALWLTISAITTPIIGFFLYVLLDPNHKK